MSDGRTGACPPPLTFGSGAAAAPPVCIGSGSLPLDGSCPAVPRLAKPRMFRCGLKLPDAHSKTQSTLEASISCRMLSHRLENASLRRQLSSIPSTWSSKKCHRWQQCLESLR
ncbi:unnamed protein product [Coccothraustes coccothraustes]